MIFFNHYALRPPIPKNIFIEHCRVEIMAIPFVLFHRDRLFNFCCLFHQRFSTACLFKCFLLPQHTTLFIRCDNPELIRWCWCSLHANIQMSRDEVLGSRDGCRHAITEGTVDMPIRLFQQIFSARAVLFSRPFA